MYVTPVNGSIHWNNLYLLKVLTVPAPSTCSPDILPHVPASYSACPQELLLESCVTNHETFYEQQL